MVLVVAMVVAVWLTGRGAVQRAGDAVFGPRIDWRNDYAMTMRLYDLVEARHLTDVRRDCLLLDIHGGDPPEAQKLDLFERPTRTCMGDAASRQRVLPRLFGLLVDRTSGRVRTDEGSPGRYHPLP